MSPDLETPSLRSPVTIEEPAPSVPLPDARRGPSRGRTGWTAALVPLLAVRRLSGVAGADPHRHGRRQCVRPPGPPPHRAVPVGRQVVRQGRHPRLPEPAPDARRPCGQQYHRLLPGLPIGHPGSVRRHLDLAGTGVHRHQRHHRADRGPRRRHAGPPVRRRPRRRRGRPCCLWSSRGRSCSAWGTPRASSSPAWPSGC